MSSIITPVQYKTLPWKNGNGQTTEMAIDENGTLECFNWRISQTTIKESGAFSDFTGYQRHQVLLDGQGMKLEHDGVMSDELSEPLDVAAYDGGCKTVGTLKGGAITVLNLITRASRYDVSVETYSERTTVELPQGQLCFVYCLDAEAVVTADDLRLPPVHLLQVTEEDNYGLKVTGERMIVACLKRIDC